jgi:hypothetical protein
MLDSALQKGLDFFVMTDHAHRNPTPIEGVTGAQAMDAIAVANDLDMHITVGAEISSMLHTTGWPLTENIWTNDRELAVQEIHAQGGIAVLCHPGVAPNYAEGLLTMESYGYDAIEIVNSNYFRGEGEFGYKWNWLGANDHHAASEVGKVGTAAFVLNPSGPNGQVSDSDLVDAVLSKRIVILDTVNSMVYGQKIWVERYLELLSEAEAAVTAAQVAVEAVKDAGNGVNLSELYIDSAEVALQYWNPCRAMKLATNATSGVALGLDFSVSGPDGLDPNEEFDLTVEFTNNHTYPVSFDARFYIALSVSAGSAVYEIAAPAEGTRSTLLDMQAAPHGVAIYYLYISNFNTSEYLMPVIYRERNVIDNVTYTVNENEAVYDVDFSFYVGRAESAFLRYVTLYYDDGSGETSIAMVKGWNTYDITLESFVPGTVITFHLVVETKYYDIFELTEQVVTIPGGEPTTTETPTTSPTGGNGTPLDPMLLVAIGGIGVVVVVVLVFVLKRKGT